MAGKPRVSEQRLDAMLEVLARHPGFVGRVRLLPDGGVEIQQTGAQTPSGGAEDPNPADLTPEELAALGSAA
ncbi:MAG: hypothetical protein AAFR64_14040 [Pseudomonadota bacterium]